MTIDNGIGDVSLTGIRIVMPTVTTTYRLTASNSEITKTATTQIIVTNTQVSAPKISWVSNVAENTMTITKGATGCYYGGTVAYLIFRNATGTNYAVYSLSGDYTLATSGILVTEDIMAGDILHFPKDGTYTIIWILTDEVIGTVTV